MTTFFISRHPGAIEWATQQGLVVDRFVAHLDPGDVNPGDTVIGTLPVHLAAKVCEQGARYFHLSLDLPDDLRGRELTTGEISAHGGRIERFHIVKATSNATEGHAPP